MDDFEKELKIGFLDEAAQGLADVEQCFLALETDPANPETLNKIFRLAHNLKGSSKAVGFDQMGLLTHEFETFILKVKNGELKAAGPVLNTMLECNDFIVGMVTALKADLGATFEIDSWISRLKSAAEQAPETTETPETILEEVEESPPVQQARAASEPITLPEPSPIVLAPAKSQESVPARQTAPGVEESIRVNVSKIETLINFIGELVILQSVAKEQGMTTDSIVLKKTLNQLQKVTKEVQDISMSLRMVPVKQTFQKMQRIVRDTAQAVNKEVSIQLIGEETEIDKTILEKINDPLVHLIRNSVDHGIESAEVRLERGKPARGQVRLAAFHKAGRLCIEVSDDGGGLDRDKLVKKAIEKGVIKEGTLVTDEQAHQLIFAPGFSTKEKVTEVSGRGVGMDVVKTNIQDLSGEIQIRSTLGQGTTFEISLPLTLAIIDGMTVTFGGERYVIPFAHVFETLRPAPSDVQANTSLGSTLMLRGENMPISKLGDYFGRASSVHQNDMIALVVRVGAKPFAIWVDDVLGQSQVVVKQLGSELRGLRGVSGCTILGDGKPALILEPAELVKRKATPMPTQKSTSQSKGSAA